MFYLHACLRITCFSILEARKGHWVPETGVRDSCEWVLGIEPGSFGRAARALQCRITPQAPPCVQNFNEANQMADVVRQAATCSTNYNTALRDSEKSRWLSRPYGRMIGRMTAGTPQEATLHLIAVHMSVSREAYHLLTSFSVSCKCLEESTLRTYTEKRVFGNVVSDLTVPRGRKPTNTG